MSLPHTNGLLPAGAGPSWCSAALPLTPPPDDGREPGWYQDPQDPRRHRYWDGDSWQTWVPPQRRPQPSEPDPST